MPPSNEASDPSTRRSSQKPTADEILAQKKLDMGVLGRVFGSRDSAPVYVAGCACIFLILMIAGIIFAPIPGDLSKSQALQVVGGFFLDALGYLFGSVSGRSKT